MANGFCKNKHQKRQKITSRTYKLLKEQLSTATKGIPKSAEHKKKLSKPKSAEHKKKLSEARKGKTGYKHSAETRKKISISNSGKKMPPKTEEWSTAHSEKLRGRKQTIDHIEKRAAARVGKKHSEETKQKIKEARAKQIITKETRLKMSESHKKKIK